MSGYEVSLLLGGFAAGAIVALIIVRYLIRKTDANGSVAITNAPCVAPNSIRVQGTLAPVDDNVCIRLNVFTYPGTTGIPDTPPPEAAAYIPPAPGVPFDVVYPLGGVTSGQVVVWAAFGKFHWRSFPFGPCGSGSGQPFAIGAAVSEPAARSYRAVIGDAAHKEIASATPEVRRALGRGEVTLAFDPLGAAPGEALWSEEDVPAGEPVRWRLTLRKVGGTHVAALELVGGSGPAMVWKCSQWHFFAGSRFVADAAHAAARLLPSLEVRPA